MTFSINFLKRSNIEISDALHSLCPGSSWSVGDTYESIDNYQSDIYPKPSKQQVEAEVQRLQEIADSYYYQRARKREYPPMTDYLDAVYWQSQGDDSKMAAYLAAIEAVKAKYPKTEA
jgi:hypothetical protein